VTQQQLNSQHAGVYKNIEITSSSRLKLVVMVYDAAIASLKQAIEYHERGDHVRRNQFLSRTQYIIHELNNALDINRGKDIAANLRNLYHFLIRQLADSLSENSILKASHSLKTLSDLREAWQTISTQTVVDDSLSRQSAAIYHGSGNRA